MTNDKLCYCVYATASTLQLAAGFDAVVGLNAPAELVAQGAVVAVTGHFDEAEADRGSAKGDAVGGHERERELAIDDEHGARRAWPESDGVNLVRGIDDGAGRQGMRAQRREDKRRQ